VWEQLVQPVPRVRFRDLPEHKKALQEKLRQAGTGKREQLFPWRILRIEWVFSDLEKSGLDRAKPTLGFWNWQCS